jgi:hypothetical protein
LSSNEITLYAEENGDSKSVDLTLVGLTAGDGVNVKIVATKLYDNSSGQDVSINPLGGDDTDFNLAQYKEKTITVTLDPSGDKAGTYEGVLMITAPNNTAPTEILTTNIRLRAIIKGTGFWYNSNIIQAIFIVLAIVPMIIGLALPDKEYPKIKYSKASYSWRHFSFFLVSILCFVSI